MNVALEGYRTEESAKQEKQEREDFQRFAAQIGAGEKPLEVVAGVEAAALALPFLVEGAATLAKVSADPSVGIARSLATTTAAGAAVASAIEEEAPAAEQAERLFGPFTHYITKGGLDAIVKMQEMIPGVARSGPGAGAWSVRAYTFLIKPEIWKGGKEAIEFVTTLEPSYIGPTQGGETAFWSEELLEKAGLDNLLCWLLGSSVQQSEIFE